MENPAESASRRPWSSRLQSSFGGNRTSPQQPQTAADGCRGRSPSLRRVGEIFRKFIAPTTPSSAAGAAPQPPHIPISQQLKEEAPERETPATPTHKREYRPRSRSHSVEQFLRRLLPSPAAAKARRPDLFQSQAAAATSSTAGAAADSSAGVETQRESGRQEEAPRGRAERRGHPSNLPPQDIGSKNSRYTAKSAAPSATAAERSPPCPRQPGQKAASAWGGSCTPPSYCKYTEGATPRSAEQQKPSATFNASSSPYFSECGATFRPQAGEASSPKAAGQHFGFGNDEGERGRKSSSSRRRSSSRRPDTSRAQHNKSAPFSPPSAADESTSNTSWAAGANGSTPHASERTAEEETNSGPSGDSSPGSPEADDVLMVETRTTQITTITTMITAQPEAGKSTIFRRSAECTVDELQQHWRFGPNNSGSSSSSSSSSASCQGQEASNGDLNGENAFRQHQQQQPQQPGGDAPAEVSQSASTAESCDATPLASPDWDAEDVGVQQQQQQEAAAQHQQQQEWHREQHEGMQDSGFGVPMEFGYTCFQQPQATEDFHGVTDSGRVNWQQQHEQLPLPQTQQQQPIQVYGQQPLQFLTREEQECGYAFVPSPASPWMQPLIASPQQQTFHPPPQQQHISPSYIQESVRQQADQRSELLELSEGHVQEQLETPHQQQQQLQHEQQCLEPQPAASSTEALQREVLLQQQLLQYQQDLLHNQRQQQLWQQQQQQLKAPRVRPFSYNAAAVMPGVFAVPPDPLLVTIRPRASRLPAAEAAAPTAASAAAAVVPPPVSQEEEIPSASVCTVRAASAEPHSQQEPQLDIHQKQQQEQQQQQQKRQEQHPVLVPCVAGRRGASSSRPPKRVSWAGAEVFVEGRGRSAAAAPHASLSLPLKGEQEAADACLSPATASTTGGTPPGSRSLSPCDPLPSLYVPMCHARHL
ncbi:hypothetical protein Emed_004073 [Eimeria media]